MSRRSGSPSGADGLLRPRRSHYELATVISCLTQHQRSIAMTPFTERCPTELLVAILSSCESLGDVKALILTCRRIHAVWLAQASLIIATIGPRVVVEFDTALIAVSWSALSLYPIAHLLCRPALLELCIRLNRHASFLQSSIQGPYLPPSAGLRQRSLGRWLI